MRDKNNRLKRLEQKLNTNEGLIEEIIISFINPDGSLDSTITSKKLKDGKWSDYEKQD